MTSIRAVLSKERVKKSGGYALVVQVLHLRRKRVMHLGYDLNEVNFDWENQRAIYVKGEPLSHKQVKQINVEIAKVKNTLTLKLESLEANGINFTSADIMAPYRKDRNDIYLFTYMQKQVNAKRRIKKIGIADAYQTTLRSVQRYLENRPVLFDDINLRFLRDYEDYLISTGVSDNTVNYYMRNLRTIYNCAFDDGLVTHGRNAFLKYHLHTVKTVKRALKKEDIRRIANLDLSDEPRLGQARDFFMFSYYTRGMSPIDILYLRHTDITDGVIFYNRKKTQQPLQVAVTKPLQKLMDKYHTDPEFVLPLIHHSKRGTLRERYKAAYGQINTRLKKVAKLAEITTTLTTYVARHSWASIAKEDGVPAAAISEGLGHDSERTTLIYLSNFDRKKIDTINQKMVRL
ncbi:MAG: site-specific integrase [Mucinivorans sp.]